MLTEVVTFQEAMADTVETQFGVAGKTVVELASDPWLLAAKRLLHHGAQRVIASNLSPGWTDHCDSQIEIAAIDARAIDQVLGENTVDVVMGINLLEHLHDIPLALEAIMRVLRPGGGCLLQGHPLWTSARGHHTMVGHMGATAHFGDASNPIPPWGHLYMSETEMRRELEVAGHSPQVIEAAVDWSFRTTEITRLPRRWMIEQVEASQAHIEALWEDRLEPPAAADIIRIKHGRWWDPSEDYSVRAMTFLLRKKPPIVTV